ncbi:MAG: DNA translocase FtsK 4TM domain-containing protein [Deltaproteobacteria bacterium]|nr:DNA translocase FtsK 4TM domain-containing protein [Deltaproteobacteria bacterium]
MTAFFKKFRQDVKTILYFGLGVFFALAIYSYNPKDPSLNSIGNKLIPENYCGWIGSFLSDFVYQAFGVSSWLIVAAFLKLSWNSFRGGETHNRNTNLIWLSFLVINFSALISFYYPDTKIFSGKIYLSGIVGLSIAHALVKVLNFAGVQIFLWCSAVILFIFYSEKSLNQIAYSLRKTAEGLKDFFSKQSEKLKTKKEMEIEKKAETDLNFRQSFKSDKFDKPDKSDKQDEKPIEEKAKSINEIEIEDYLPRRKVILKVKTPKRVENWEMPKLSLLDDPPLTRVKIEEKEIRRKADILTDKLRHFSVEGMIVDAKPGPLVTMFEFKPNADVKLSKITELQDDLALALSSESLRVIAPIPGRDVVGIETSNSKRETVYYKDLLEEEAFWSDEFKLPIALGRQVNGEPKIVDLRKMPHLLVAGTTGSGKSVLITSIIAGLIFKHSPKTLRLILVDPKQVDLAAYANIPHLLMPPVTDPKKAVTALKWAIREMEKRYKSMSKFGARGLEGFNETVSKLSAEEILEHEKINKEYESQGVMKLEQYYYAPLPYVVIVVEEFGDLMAVDKQNVEHGVVRLAQMARASGMHLILAMQSPRKEVVTGLIKTNIPGRVGLKVASKMDSRIILDEGGAERLLPNGDMLFLAPGISKPMRHHGPYLSEKEINGLAEHWSIQGAPEYDAMALKALETNLEGSEGDSLATTGDEDIDEMYDQILSWTAEQKEVSASLLQRRFRLGYPRAARIIEIFEKEGVVGPSNGSKPRSVLVNSLNH